MAHDEHEHAPAVDADRRLLTGALALIVAYLVGEATAGVLSGSLALLSDAAHLLTDAGALALALVAARLAARPPGGRFTYGLRRVEILSAQANGLTLLVLAAWLAYEAVRRLLDPPPVDAGVVLATALVGVAVNLVVTWLLSRANRRRLNVRGAFLHILTDLFAFLATAAAGLVMLLTGFHAADGIASLIVVALMVRAAVGLLRDSGRVFLEAAPAGVDPAALGERLAGLPGVAEVHDLHVWTITSGEPALSAHVLVERGHDCHGVRREMERLLRADRIEHTTLQVDHADATAPARPERPHTGADRVAPDRTGDDHSQHHHTGHDQTGHAVGHGPAEHDYTRHDPGGYDGGEPRPCAAEPYCADTHGPVHRPVRP